MNDDEYFDDLLRRAARTTDPWRQVDPGPPLSGAELRRRAAAPDRRPWGSRVANAFFEARLLIGLGSGPRLTAAAGFALSLLVIAGVWAVQSGSRQADRDYGAPAILPMEFTDRAPAARPALKELAGQAAAAKDPAQAGDFTYVRVQTWSADLTSEKTARTGGFTATDEQLWLAPDRSGRRVITDLPEQHAGTSIADFVGPVTALPDARRVDEFASGELSVVIDHPAVNPEVLSAQLTYHDPSRGPQAALRTIASLFRYHAMTPAQRGAALVVLSNTDQVAYRGHMTDRAGRRGLAFSADSPDGATRDILIFEEGTGRLLSYEQILLIRPARVDIPVPSLSQYVIYLTGRHQVAYD